MFCPPIVEDRRLANLIKNYGLWTNTSSKDKAVPTNRTIDGPVLKDAKVILNMLENLSVISLVLAHIYGLSL